MLRSVTEFFLFFLLFHLIEESLGLSVNDRTQNDQGDQVRYSHESVQDICDVPNVIQAQGRSDDNEENEDDLVDRYHDLIALKDEFTATDAVQRPAHDGRQSKEAEAHGNDDRTDTGGKDRTKCG